MGYAQAKPKSRAVIQKERKKERKGMPVGVVKEGPANWSKGQN